MQKRLHKRSRIDRVKELRQKGIFEGSQSENDYRKIEMKLGKKVPVRKPVRKGEMAKSLAARKQERRKALSKIESATYKKVIEKLLKKGKKFVKEDEDIDGSSFYAAVPAELAPDSGGLELGGSVLIGPFASADAAEDAAEAPVDTVSGGDVEVFDDDDASVGIEVIDVDTLESIKGKFEKRRNSIKESVLRRIKAEGDKLPSLDTDVRDGTEVTDQGAGTLDFEAPPAVATQDPSDAGKQNDLPTPTDDEPNFQGIDKSKTSTDTMDAYGGSLGSIGENEILVGRNICQEGSFVRIIDTRTNKQIDSGIVSKVTNEEVSLGSNTYRFDKYQVIRFA
jgi:hypothetical protein